MGISVLGATGSDNWIQIAATNPAASSLNFTGISGYKKLMVWWAGASGGGLSLSSVRFNSDSGSKYAYNGTHSTSAPSYAQDVSVLTTSAVPLTNPGDLKLIINSCDNTNLKTYEYIQPSTYIGTGFYQASAAITSVNLAWSTTFNYTVYLYGVLA